MVLLTQPTTAHREAGLQFPDHPELWLAAFRGQPVQAQEQARLGRNGTEPIDLLAFETGQQGQVLLMIQVTRIFSIIRGQLGPVSDLMSLTFLVSCGRSPDRATACLARRG